MAKIVIADTGRGMTKEVASRAVDPFFTTKARGTGTGLGLATTHGTVCRAGGMLEIHTEVGKGTKIGMLIPLTKASGPSVGNILRTVPPVNPQRIMLVEDHKIVAQAVKEMLKSRGHAVSVYHSAEPAWEEIKQAVPIDLLISDVVMPGMSGVELAKRVIGFSSSIKIVADDRIRITRLEELR